ncbi:MAG: Crp/Fnr family transcriptional regulator [Litorimonas sp.]
MLINILKNHWLFTVLDEEQLLAVSKKFSIKSYEKGQYVFHQSDVPKHLYVILNGEVSIETHSIEGKVIKITHLDDTEIFGELALIDSGARSAGARVTKPTKLALLSDSAFRALIKQNHHFSQKLLVVLVERLRKTNNQVESLVSQSLMQRTAKLLFEFQSKDGRILKMTQNELGERLFASREKVNMKLKKLEKLKAITTHRGRIEILNPELLESLGNQSL